ncbi:AcrR family transcriptional regulator [Sinobacterium caligoides]|uniref:AcrR family transcriptional regulator n=1 Tax=Sinobacterium caligoides TaxID=933926 RepID=A0A3N2DDU0_9GAMM|nr:TetR/AcrR family transcriptional regulator [Sinobacterium caligoides]ROR97961.1 AcrR family transcriptional regulator [Sinobacterium caligoides]
MSDRRARRLQETHDRIVQALEDYLSAEMDTGITIDELCERADVARKTFYNHFSGLDQPYMELTLRHIVALDGQNSADAERQAQGLMERFDLFCRYGMRDAERWGWLHWNLLIYGLQATYKMDEESAAVVRTMIQARSEHLFGAAARSGELDGCYSAEVLGEFTKGIETGIAQDDALKYLQLPAGADIAALSSQRVDNYDEFRRMMLALLSKHMTPPAGSVS